MTDPDPPSNGGAGAGRAARSRPGRDQVVADLDAELRATRRELTVRLDALAAELATTSATAAGTTGLVAETIPRFEDLAGEVAELRGRLDQLTASDPPDPETPPVCWPALDVAEAETAWNALARWIAEVLGPWYQPTRAQLPDCWALHRPALLELSWLHTTWTDAHLPKARPAATAEWHTRWRPAALAAVAAAIPTQQCRAAPDRPGEHLVSQLASSFTGTADRSTAAGTHPYGPPPGTTTPGPAAAPGPGRGREFTDPAEQVTTPAFWGHYFEQAKAADLDWRRRAAAANRNVGAS